ncbi:MAG: hypothetical protein IT377_11925 [Polyangiaceae bacterium]|nr:hypothetical protein [Polyangiaceae bacterium]
MKQRDLRLELGLFVALAGLVSCGGGEVGDDCSSHGDCDDGLFCDLMGGETCQETRGGGASCAYGWECSSGSCTNHTDGYIVDGYTEKGTCDGASSGTGGSGSCGDLSACDSYKQQCSGTVSQAPCYCAAACVCHYCGDPACESQSRGQASQLGTSCSY